MLQLSKLVVLKSIWDSAHQAYSLLVFSDVQACTLDGKDLAVSVPLVAMIGCSLTLLIGGHC